MSTLASSDVTHGLATAIAEMREMLAPIDEAVTGYRKQLEGAGWSPTAAETMALELHRLLMANIIASAAQGGRS